MNPLADGFFYVDARDYDDEPKEITSDLSNDALNNFEVSYSFNSNSENNISSDKNSVIERLRLKLACGRNDNEHQHAHHEENPRK